MSGLKKLQYKILYDDGQFYKQKDIAKCILQTAENHEISEKDVENILLQDRMSEGMFFGEGAFHNALYLLKHEQGDIDENALHLLETEGISIKKIDIGGYGEYDYSLYNMEIERDGFNQTYEDMQKFEQLKIAGVTTIEVIPIEELKEYQKEFDDTLLNFPEYMRDDKNPSLDANGNPITYVAGGFAALGNPASFHNPFSRKLRRLAFKRFYSLLQNYVNVYNVTHERETYNLQALADRMMYRTKGQAPVAEAWHRDVMPPKKIEYDDEIFGGWINLDSVDQYFSCIPGSHNNKVQKTLDHGFATLTGAIEKIYKQAGQKKPSDKEIKSYITELAKDRYKFKVPPGHMVIFPQYILHEVVANKAKYNMRRQFTGWRVTKTKTPLYPLEMFDEQAVIPLPGGMIPPMYSRNHISYFQDKPFQLSGGVKYSLKQWSEATFKEECLTKKGDGWIVVRHMKSLEEYGFKMYPPYSDEEKEIYRGKEIKYN